MQHNHFRTQPGRACSWSSSTAVLIGRTSGTGSRHRSARALGCIVSTGHSCCFLAGDRLVGFRQVEGRWSRTFRRRGRRPPIRRDSVGPPSHRMRCRPQRAAQPPRVQHLPTRRRPPAPASAGHWPGPVARRRSQSSPGSVAGRARRTICPGRSPVRLTTAIGGASSRPIARLRSRWASVSRTGPELSGSRGARAYQYDVGDGA